MNASKIILIVHFWFAHPSLLGHIDFAVKLLLGIESVPVLSSNVLRVEDLVWFPSYSIQICVILRVPACHVLRLAPYCLRVLEQRVVNMRRILICDLVSCLPLLLH